MQAVSIVAQVKYSWNTKKKNSVTIRQERIQLIHNAYEMVRIDIFKEIVNDYF